MRLYRKNAQVISRSAEEVMWYDVSTTVVCMQ